MNTVWIVWLTIIYEKTCLGNWEKFPFGFISTSVQTKPIMFKRLRAQVSTKFSVPSKSHVCSQTMAVENKFFTYFIEVCELACMCVSKSWGKLVLASVSSLSHMCALGMTVYRRAGVANSTVFWVVVAVFRILSWAVAPWATNHHRAAKKTEGWTDPTSVQGESKRHQAVLMKHSNREPHRRHHPTQRYEQYK